MSPRRPPSSAVRFAAFLLAACGSSAPAPPVTPVDGGPRFPDAGPCAPLGEPCFPTSGCCEGRCENNVCVSSTTQICADLGASCNAGSECCSGRCEPSAVGIPRCVPPGCAKGGEACRVASDCCSLACGACSTLPSGATSCTCLGPPPGVPTDGGPPPAGDAGPPAVALCKTTGMSCSAAVECCSGFCPGGTCQTPSIPGYGCKVAGEPCALADDGGAFGGGCCSDFCAPVGTESRCGLSSFCKAGGEICTGPSECCAGACVDLDGGFGGVGRCALLGRQQGTGEPCRENDECATHACTRDPSGARYCQPLGGCKVFNEVCTHNCECCAGRCEVPPGVGQNEGVKRCLFNPHDWTPTTGRRPAGELCRAADGTNLFECQGTCEVSSTGIGRCVGGQPVPGCTPGAPADAGGPPPADAGPLPDGGRTCRPAGQPCAQPDECCTRVCVNVAAEGGVEFRCAAACVAVGGSCTTGADCCSLVCDLASGGVCRAPPTDAGVCRPLGSPCAMAGECCSGVCSSGLCRVNAG